VVSIANRLETESFVFRVPADSKDFLSYTMPREMLRPTQLSFPGKKGLASEVNHSLPPRTEVENWWS